LHSTSYIPHCTHHPLPTARNRPSLHFGVDTRDSLGCDQLRRYAGFNKGNDKVAVTKGSGTWGGGK